MKLSKGVKRTLLVVGTIIIVVPILLVAFASPIAKYVVEKYSVKWTGRQIRMKWAYVNPFTGHVHMEDFKIYEANSDSLFFEAKGVNGDISMRKMLSQTYDITQLTFEEPNAVVILNKRNDFNFSDIIERFSSKGDTTNTTPSKVYVDLRDLKVVNGTFYFYDTLADINYCVKNMNFETKGKPWDVDSIDVKFSFESGTGTGSIDGAGTVDFRNSDYKYQVHAHKYSLDIIEQYLQSMVNYGSFKATIDADLTASGNMKDPDNVDTHGRIVVNNFHFGKTPTDDYMSFDKFLMVVNETNPEKHIYNLDTVALYHPYFKYEEYDYLDNVETMFGKNISNVTAVKSDSRQFNLILELGHYLAEISKNFFDSPYKINHAAMVDGNIRFNDYSGSEEFSAGIYPLTISADSIDKTKNNINVGIKLTVKPYGEGTVKVSINPRDNQSFDVQTHFSNVPVTMFNPYIISYTSFPMYRGTVDFTSDWKVRHGEIESLNHLLVIDPLIAPRVNNKGYSWIPVWLVMAVARNRSNVIDYQVPITGSLKNPKFHLKDVIFGVIKNIFVKPPTTSYGLKVKNTENEIKEYLTLRWDMRQAALMSDQERFLKKLMNYLTDNPTASVRISPMVYEAKEREYIMFFEAKKKYYLAINNKKASDFNKKDSLLVEEMSIKDTLFMKYLDKHVAHELEFTVQGKCQKLISSSLINTRLAQLNAQRKNAFLAAFIAKGLGNRIVFNPVQDNIPYNGYSYYQIKYKGDLPDGLLRAYREMNKLNAEAPREKYDKDRKGLSLL